MPKSKSDNHVLVVFGVVCAVLLVTALFFGVLGLSPSSGKPNPTPTPTFTPYPTATPTPTPTPTSHSSSTLNAIWCFQGDLDGLSGAPQMGTSKAFLQNCKAHQIFDIFLSVGYPNPSQYSSLAGIVPITECGIVVSQSQVTADLALLASVDSRFRLWAWFGTWSNSGGGVTHGPYADVDISTPSNRVALITVITQVAQWGFYGVQDDVEGTTEGESLGQMGSQQVAYWNAEAVALHNVGVKLATDTPAVWYNFNMNYVSQLTGIDYVICAPLCDAVGFPLDCGQFIPNCNCPVIMYISTAWTGTTLGTELGYIDALSPTLKNKIVGYAIYSSDYGTPSSSEWASWNAWSTKNLS